MPRSSNTNQRNDSSSRIPKILIRKILWTVILVGFATVLVFSLRQQKNYLKISEDFVVTFSKSKGNPNTAEIKVIEYLDFQCHACKIGSEILQGYMEKFPGKIYVSLRHFPLEGHQFGARAALYSECAARQDRFWQMHDLLFEGQQIWSQLSPEAAETYFQEIARKAGINEKALGVCLGDLPVQVQMNKEQQEGISKQVMSTPTYFINGEMLVGYEMLAEKLKLLFDEGPGN